MEIMNGGKALMKALEKEGVKEVFGLPGGANLPMYDELFKSDIRHILVRHEQSAAHMADGFGRVSRKPGVCFATSGPCLLYTSPSPRDLSTSRMPSSA